MKQIFFIVATTLLFILLASQSTFAKLGVGIGTGKIVVDEEIKAGVIYDLPDLTILNTGDEFATYAVRVTYHQEQPEKRPPVDWFQFTPEEFGLEPGDGEVVKVRLNLPVKAEPGDYFAYLEGSPTKKDQTGGTNIGIAAASKLYFTIAPSNVFEGTYYRLTSLYKQYLPWTNIMAVILIVVIILGLVRKFFNFSFSVKKKEKPAKDETKDE